MKKMPLVLAVVIACMCASSSVQAKPKKFTVKSFKGSYATALNGTIAFAGGLPVFLPAWFVGVIEADGKGAVSRVNGKLNVGGCVIVTQTGSGTYAVNEDGTGAVSATVVNAPAPVGTTNAPCPILGLAFPPTVGLDIEFVIVDKETLNGLAVSLKDAGGKPIVAFGASGQAQRQ